SPSMNFIEGQLVQNAGGIAFQAEGWVDIPVPTQRAERLSAAVGQSVFLGIRPEHTMVGIPTFQL
ncbi:sugar ABC transporter ATP-binding protein, partial [Rhizobium johnstonii]